jgi:hypothetical protein
MNTLDYPKFRLRYRFEYYDGKPSVSGKWDSSGEHPANQAWTQKREGLARVIIEGKHHITKEVETIVDCSGQDYRMLQWIAAGFFSRRQLNKAGNGITPLTRNIGMALWTSDKKIAVFNNGVVHIEELNDSERKYHFATYGR